MIDKKCFAILLVGLLYFCPLHASQEQYEHPKPAPQAADFKDLQKLVGSWEGMNQTHKGKQMIRVSYYLSSGNSALVEQIFKGSPEEMVSIYHSDKGNVIMTHYCSLGNQPRMELEKRQDNTFLFGFKDGTNMKRKDPHMRSMTLTMVDDNTLRQEWTMYDKGKAKDTVVFNFTRVK